MRSQNSSQGTAVMFGLSVPAKVTAGSAAILVVALLADSETAASLLLSYFAKKRTITKKGATDLIHKSNFNLKATCEHRFHPDPGSRLFQSLETAR